MLFLPTAVVIISDASLTNLSFPKLLIAALRPLLPSLCLSFGDIFKTLYASRQIFRMSRFTCQPGFLCAFTMLQHPFNAANTGLPAAR